MLPGLDSLLDGLAAVGASIREFILTSGRLMRFVAGVARHGLPPPPVQTVHACWELVSQCVLPVTLVVVPMGALISLQAAAIIQRFGVERLLGPLVAITVVRELAPGFAALMVAMQAGTSLAAEIAVMRVRDELDAYEIMAVDPLRFVVAPRLLAGPLIAPLLAVLAMGLAVMGSWLVAVGAKGFSSYAFLDGCLSAISPWDVGACLIKSAVFGFMLSSLACFEGWHAHKSAEGVGRASNRSTVGAILSILVANYVLNSLLYAGTIVLAT